MPVLFIVSALYASAAVFAVRKLLAGLPLGLSLVSLAFLVAQALVVGVALTYRPPSESEYWLWHLDREWNIPATLASLQSAMVGFVALLIAWRAQALPAWHRLYFVGLGAVLLFVGFDEYAELHEFVAYSDSYYFVLGGVIAAATAAIAALAQPSIAIWHAWLLAGLATAAMGGLVLETNCSHPIVMTVTKCGQHHLIEEPLEFLGMWLALTALLNLFRRLLPGSHSWRILYILPIVWLLLAVGGLALLRHERYASGLHKADIMFESGLRLHGYRLQRTQQAVQLHLSPGAWDYSARNFADTIYFIVLVDQESGDVVLTLDAPAQAHRLHITPRLEPVFAQRMSLASPHRTPLPANRAYSVALSLWREQDDGSYAQDRIVASDRPLFNDWQVVLDEFVVESKSPPTAELSDGLANFEIGFVLEAAEAPDVARASESVPLTFIWRSDVDADSDEDHVQLLHLNLVGSDKWWAFDRQPLGRRLPTRLWYEGMVDSETWQVTLPEALPAGRYQVYTGLYRVLDKERIPASSAEGVKFRDHLVPLGEMTIAERAGSSQ